MSKPWYLSKTIRVNVLTFLIAVALLIAGTDGLGLSEVAIKWLLVASGIGNIALRLVTTEPIGSPRPDTS